MAPAVGGVEVVPGPAHPVITTQAAVNAISLIFIASIPSRYPPHGNDVAMLRGRVEDISAVLQRPGLVVVDKPAGVLSVPGKGEANQACVATWVREHFPHAQGPITVHRLDMETSGLMVVALNASVHRALSALFERRQVEKHYEALIAPGLRSSGLAESGEIDLPLRPDIDRRPIQIVDRIHGRPSRTLYRVLDDPGPQARLALEPLTGRSHQLRLHCAHPADDGGLGRPIIGDRLYGGLPAARLMLHAVELAFTAPDGEPIRVQRPAPF